MVRIKTVIKSSLFIILFVALLIYLFTGDDSENLGTLPTTPAVPEVPTEVDSNAEDPEDEGGGEGAESDEVPIDIPPPEQIGLDDTQLENRPMFIETTQANIEGHEFLLANDDYEMYFKEENLSIIMRDKHTGAVMYSTIDDPVESNEEWTNFMQSSFVLEYLVGTNIVVYRADMYSGNPEKEVTYLDDGFIAKISYPEIEISFEVQVTLADEGFNVEVLQDNIEENNDRYKVAGLYVYPFLGYSKLGEREGYMFIPDGSGGLIHLKDNDGKYKQPYSEMVYGENVGIDDAYVLSLFNRMNPFNDPENILAPVFGMVQTDSQMGYLGIIEEGEFSAKIEAYPSGAILPYNWITSRFIYRQVYNQPTSQDTGSMVVRQRDMNRFDIKVRYDFVSEEKADYVGLAEKYRGYLLDHQLITQKEDEFKARIDLFGSDVEKGLIFKKDIPMTTFSQARDILNDLQNNGVEDILSVYKGWQENGYYGGLPISSFKPESNLSDDLTIQELIDESQMKEIELYLYHDALRINTEEVGGTKHKVMKKFNKRTYDEGVYGKVYRTLNYLNPQSTVNILEQMKQIYAKNNVENIMIGGISNELFSYSEGNKEFDRIQTKEHYESIISDYHSDFHLMLEQPYAYLWDYTSRIIDLPTRSSNYVFTDEDIPFIALTLKGIVPLYAEYTNFQANQVEFFLQLVEQGLNPSFYITHEDPSELLYTNSSDIYSSKYDRYDEMIEEYYKELKAVHDQTNGSMILDYERINDVTKVTYDNGTIVYVNYQEDDTIIDGQNIEGLSYKVVTNH
jgi:hypothetical protein